MKEAPRDVYFEDVKLQMDSKLWGERYNRLTVPKKVCVWSIKLDARKVYLSVSTYPYSYDNRCSVLVYFIRFSV